MHEELPFSHDHHRLRADRGGHGHRHRTRRRLRDHRHHRRPRPSGARDPHRRRRRHRACRSGESGEVLVRGYSVMRGYLDDPDATARADRRRRLAAHRRPRHARRARVPAHRRAQEGHVHRRRLQRVPGRDREPAARPPRGRRGSRWSGMPDERLGEVGMAFVVLAPGAELDPDELIAWARGSDGQLQGAARGRDRRRAPGQRGGQGREGDAARPCRGARRSGRRSRGHPLLAGAARAAAQRGRRSSTTSARGRSTTSTTTSGAARLADAALRSGWFELRGPGDDDGPLASGVEVAIVARELGRAAADTPFFGPVVAADLARQAGLELEDARASVVLDAALLDLARRARRRCGRRRRGRLRRCGTRPRAGRPTAVTAHVVEVELADAGAGDRPHPRARAGRR